MLFGILNQIVNQFSKKNEEEEIVVFPEPFEVDTEGLITGIPDSASDVINVDELVFDESDNIMIKMQIEYYAKDKNIYLLSIHMWREVKE